MIDGKKMYTVLAKIGKFITFEFNAYDFQNSENIHLRFLRTSDGSNIDSIYGALYVNLKDNTIGLSYDCVTLTARIANIKNAGEHNYMFDCVSGRFKMKVIVAETELWEQYKESMFREILQQSISVLHV